MKLNIGAYGSLRFRVPSFGFVPLLLDRAFGCIGAPTRTKVEAPVGWMCANVRGGHPAGSDFMSFVFVLEKRRAGQLLIIFCFFGRN
jgi:hypothetical protein